MSQFIDGKGASPTRKRQLRFGLRHHKEARAHRDNSDAPQAVWRFRWRNRSNVRTFAWHLGRQPYSFTNLPQQNVGRFLDGENVL